MKDGRIVGWFGSEFCSELRTLVTIPWSNTNKWTAVVNVG